MFVGGQNAGVSARYQGFAAVVAAVVVVSVVIGGVGATSSPGPALQTGNGTTGNGTTANGTAANVTFAPHQNPEEIREEGDSQRVAEHLASRLGTRLAESAVAFSEQDLERGQTLLGEGYDEKLTKYATIARDIDEEELATQFNLTREEQAALAETLRETETLATEYQRAVENGDNERARELARDLLEQAEEVNRTTAELEDRYTVLENQTGTDLGEAYIAIEEIRRTTGEATVAIQTREFTETQLFAETNRTRISVSNPARVSGRLTTANGTPVEDGTIRVRLGGDTVVTETSENGTFIATYRPILAPLNASAVAVSYEPDPTDPYLPVTDTIGVSIVEQAETSVEVTNASTTAAFNEPIRALGTVDVTGLAAERTGGIPVVLSVDERRLATGTTDPGGDVDLEGSLPAAVPAGENDLRVAIDRQDVAIARSTATAPISIQETPTALSIEASADEGADAGAADGEGEPDGAVTVSGRLTAEAVDGEESERGLADRPVALSIDGGDVRSIETDANGTYRTTVTIPEPADAGDRLSVTATFDGGGTSLAGSTAEGSVVVTRPNASGTGGVADAVDESESIAAVSDTAVESTVVAGVVALLLALGALLAVRWRDPERLRRLRQRVFGGGSAGSEPETMAAGGGGSVAAGAAASRGRGGDDTDDDTASSPLQQARAELTAGRPDEAVRIAYVVVRSRLGRSVAETSSETHWEFYRRWRDDKEVDSAGLETVTEAYEQAEFAPDEVSSQTADDAVDASNDIIGTSGTERGSD